MIGIDPHSLAQALLMRSIDLLGIRYGSVYLRAEDESLRLIETPEPAGNTHAPQLDVNSRMLTRLTQGLPVSRPAAKPFPLLLPLIPPGETGTHRPLMGVLALGPRRSDHGYSKHDISMLSALAEQAGAAIYLTRLIEAQRPGSAPHKDSKQPPSGRRDSMIQAILDNPTLALIALHELTQAAGQNADAATLLGGLPGLLDLAGEGPLARLAEAYLTIFRSQSEPELSISGLHELIDSLTIVEASTLQHRDEALTLYRLCRQAANAETIGAIADMLDNLQSFRSPECPSMLAELCDALDGLIPATESLFAYEHVDTSQDRLAYLAAAVERLGEVTRKTRLLGAADRPIVQQIAENWLAIVTRSMSDLQIRAHITCQLVTRNAWNNDLITLALQLRNDGHGAALNLRVRLAESPEYTPVDDVVVVEQLVTGDEVQVELHARPHLAHERGQFRARFTLQYDDPRGTDQGEHFADAVRLMPSEGAFQFIPNPYVVGTPLQAGSPLFFGRDEVFAFIDENLRAEHRNNLVLIGQRRTGKSSLLKQLPARLGDGFVPVYLDGQSIALEPGLSAFFFNVAVEIAYVLEDRGFSFKAPEPGDFAESPVRAFERRFLHRVRESIGERHLILLLDEFEELEAMVQRGRLDTSVFGFLRHLIQHTQGLSVIFCGTHRMEELSIEHWNVLFNISLYRHIGFLTQPEATRLIQDPVSAYDMHYDDLALDKIWRVTAGHPYFLQLLSHSLVNLHNRSQRSYVTVTDVNTALDEILSSSEAHFVYLWAESTREEQLALTALSRMIPSGARATSTRIAAYLANRGVALDRQIIGQALHHLALRDILSLQVERDSPDSDDSYSWRLGLLAQWIEKYKSITRIQEEISR